MAPKQVLIPKDLQASPTKNQQLTMGSGEPVWAGFEELWAVSGPFLNEPSIRVPLGPKSAQLFDAEKEDNDEPQNHPLP